MWKYLISRYQKLEIIQVDVGTEKLMKNK